MKTIKILIAASEEMHDEKLEFSHLITAMNKALESRGIELERIKWTPENGSIEDYQTKLSECEMCLTLYWRELTGNSEQEFGTAYQNLKDGNNPKHIYVFFKETDEELSEALRTFKTNFVTNYGHFFCKFQNVDTMNLQFILQFEAMQNRLQTEDKLVSVADGQVKVGDESLVELDNVPFAAANEDYIKFQQEIHELRDEIEDMQLELEKKQQKLEKKKAKLEKDPDDEDYQEEYQEVKEEVDKLVEKLQPKLNKYNKQKEEFAEYQNLLFNTAKRVARLQGERVTERMSRAMNAFNEGKVREANIILDEAELDAQRNLEDYKQSKELTELKRQAAINSIEELLLKTSTIMADSSLPIEERIVRTEKIYAQADEMAGETDYDKEKYTKLLYDYAEFLRQYARYDKALQIYERQIEMSDGIYGTEHERTAKSYDGFGEIYYHLGIYSKALEYFQRSLTIRTKIIGLKHPDTAISYNNMGGLYNEIGESLKALEFHQKALEIRKNVLGEENVETARSYNNIGVAYYIGGDYGKAMDYSRNALKIRKNILGEENVETAISYNNLGKIYHAMNYYSDGMEYFKKALMIFEKVLGLGHPYTATLYNNLGMIHHDKGDYSNAIDFFQKSITILLKVIGFEHPDTAKTYNNMGAVYNDMRDYSKALEYYQKALDIRKKVLGEEHRETAISYNNVGLAYRELKQLDKSLEYIEKAYNIAVAIGDENIKATLLNRLGRTYAAMGEIENARAKFHAVLDLLPDDHPEAIDSKKRLMELSAQ